MSAYHTHVNLVLGTAQTTGFGTTGQQQQSGGLFGAQPAQPKTGLFGAAPTTTAGNAFGGFGTTAPAFTMGSSLFGTAAPATSAPGTSLFGAPATTTIGASNVLGNAAGSGGMFAQPQPAAFGGGSGLFGQQSTTSGLFGLYIHELKIKVVQFYPDSVPLLKH